ncbi:MAG: hypothetical protein OEV39_02535 [Gammaproteobacteria bacterium]|jgi:hypothetical protein|nr:hypothetical protein [Gammaproteobacteria bacterium]
MEQEFMMQPLRRAAAATTTIATVLAAGAMLAFPGLVRAQDNIEAAEAKALIEASRAEIRAGRDALIAMNLPLTPAESDVFWPLYREYNTKRAELWDTRLQIVMDYASKYPDVDDATAKDLIQRSLAYDRKLAKLEDTYAAKFLKILPAAKVMRFMQIDSRIETLVESQVQQTIPVIEPKP